MHTHVDWDDLRLVLAVLRAGTFLGASRGLGLSHSTVSRRLVALEAELGARLVERTPDGLLATAAGESLRAVAERTEADVQRLRHAIDGRDMRLRGPVRVAMPYLLATYLLMPCLAQFARRYPDIELQLVAGYEHADLTRREADVAIRVTNTPPESAVGRRVATLEVGLYGPTSSRARQPPRAYVGLDDGRPVPRWYLDRQPNASIGARVNDYPLALEAVRAGVGAALLPVCVARGQAGLRLLERRPELAVGLWLLTHAELRRTARVRALLDWLVEVVPSRVTLGAARSKSA